MELSVVTVIVIATRFRVQNLNFGDRMDALSTIEELR